MTHAKFDNFILACIGINCVLLALDDPTADAPPAWMTHFDSVLSLIFLVEFTLKLLAWRVGKFDPLLSVALQ